MEKLLDLLNEYDPPREGEPMREYSDFISYNGMCKDYSELLCISKRYGFIKWLVDGQKIDTYPNSEEFELKIRLDNGNYGNLGGEDRILMLLSIQDEPIQFLISLLK